MEKFYPTLRKTDNSICSTIIILIILSATHNKDFDQLLTTYILLYLSVLFINIQKQVTVVVFSIKIMNVLSAMTKEIELSHQDKNLS